MTLDVGSLTATNDGTKGNVEQDQTARMADLP